MRRPAPSRPPIPDRPEYGPAKGNPISWEAAELLLVDARYYWLSTTRPDGRPHAVPVWAVWQDGRLFFATGRGTVTATNLQANPNAVAHPDNPREVVILEGSAIRLRETAPAHEAAVAYEAKYGWSLDPMDPGMPFYELRPRIVLAWLAEDVRGTASRWRL